MDHYSYYNVKKNVNFREMAGLYINSEKNFLVAMPISGLALISGPPRVWFIRESTWWWFIRESTWW